MVPNIDLHIVYKPSNWHVRHFWSFLVVSGHFGIFLASFWGSFDHIFGPFWVLFGPFEPIVGHFFLLYFAIFGGFFGKSTATLSKMMQERAKRCKILPKFTKIMQNCAKTSPFSPLKHLFCLKTVEIQVSTYESVQLVGVPGSILSGFWVFFMHLHEGVHGFWVFFFW